MFWPTGSRASPFRGDGWFRPTGPRRWMGQALRCWRTDNGGAVCSDLLYYSPNCPTTPPITETDVLATPPEAPGAS